MNFLKAPQEDEARAESATPGALILPQPGCVLLQLSEQDFVLKTGKRQCVKRELSSLMINKGPLGETVLASALRRKYSGVVTGK